MIIIILIILIILTITTSNNYKTIGGGLELIGEGFEAKIYKIDDKTVLRRFKVYPNDEFNKAQPCWNEINFYNFVKTLKPKDKKHFLTMYKYEFKKISPDEFIHDYKYKTKHIDMLKNSDTVLDIYVDYVPNPLVINKKPIKLLYEDYNKFIKTVYDCLYLMSKNGWDYKDMHLGNIMLSDKGDYVFIDHGSATRRIDDTIISSKVFILKSLLFIDEYLDIPKYIENMPLYDYVIKIIQNTNEEMYEKIKKAINNDGFDNDMLKPYNYIYGYRESLKFDFMIYLNLFDRSLFFEVIKVKPRPMISDKIIPLLFKIMKAKSYKEIVKIIKTDTIKGGETKTYIALGETKPGKEQTHRDDWYNLIFGLSCNKELLVDDTLLKTRQITPHKSAIFASKFMDKGDLLFETNGGIGSDTIVLASKYKKIITCEINEERANIIKENMKTLGLDHKVKVINKSCLNVINSELPITHIYMDPAWHNEKNEIITETHLFIDNIPVDELIDEFFKTVSTLKKCYVKYPLNNNCIFKNSTTKEIPLDHISGITSTYKLHIITR